MLRAPLAVTSVILLRLCSVATGGGDRENKRALATQGINVTVVPLGSAFNTDRLMSTAARQAAVDLTVDLDVSPPSPQHAGTRSGAHLELDSDLPVEPVKLTRSPAISMPRPDQDIDVLFFGRYPHRT